MEVEKENRYLHAPSLLSLGQGKKEVWLSPNFPLYMEIRLSLEGEITSPDHSSDTKRKKALFNVYGDAIPRNVQT